MSTNIAGDENLAREIYEREIDARRMSACLMTRYRRTAFQRDESNEIRISLDTELRWQDVRTLGAGAIARPLDDSRAHVFRYAVLEIKLAYADEAPPGWLDAIVRSFDVVEVYKFSKYQHGCALLYPNALQKFPHWYGCDAVVVDVPKTQQRDVDMGERSESSSSFNELVRAAVATIKTCRRSDAKRVDANTTVMRGDAPSRLRHVPVKVEPKTFSPTNARYCNGCRCPFYCCFWRSGYYRWSEAPLLSSRAPLQLVLHSAHSLARYAA